MFRVLIVDDSATARGLLAAIFSADPELQVVGEATDGAQGVVLTRKLRPDVVTMDVRMPNMDGFEATKEIMIETPTPIVIISSSRSVLDVEASMDALRVGALAIVEKPVGPAMTGFDEAAQNLVALVKSMAQVKVVRHWRPKPASRATITSVASTSRIKVIAIASSTGGPAALHEVLVGLPPNFPLSILVVQHISHGFIQGLADWLNKAVSLNVKVAEDSEPLKQNTVYLAPDDRHLGVASSGTTVLSAAPAIGGFRPSATFLFDSVARVYGASSASVMLTGMGEDGVEGLRVVSKAGGYIVAQDEKSSVVFGMPGAAVAAGLVHEVLPLEDISRRLAEICE